MLGRAKELAQIAVKSNADHAMVGGAAYFVPILERELDKVGVKPIHSFTQRESEDKVMEDGSVQKVSVFKHVGWVGL